MSSKTSDAVTERRLRPIYDHLDTGANKKAVHEADKVLKKQRDNTCAKALKSLAFLRMGKTEESKDLVAEIMREVPSDEPTLQAMSICLREMSRADLIITMFEGAIKAKPNSEEVLSHLFMSYVRTSDYKKQKDVALQLYKINEHTPFYLWAVMSVVMQAKSPEGEKLSKSVLLPMAERMIQKLVKEEKIADSGEVELLLMILELQQKYDDALLVLKGPLGTKLNCEPYQREVWTSRLLKEKKSYPELCAIFRRLVFLQPDDWLWLREYLTHVFILMRDDWKPEENFSCSEGQVDSTLESAAGVVTSLTQASLLNANAGTPNGTIDTNPSSSSSRPSRGALLAQLEFLRQAKENGSDGPAKTLVDSAVNLVRVYFDHFGDKASFFADVKTWLPLVQGEDIEELVVQLAPLVGAANLLGVPINTAEMTLPNSVQQLQRHLNWSKLWLYSGQTTSLSEPDRKSAVVEFVARHRDGLRFGVDLKKTEVQFSDDYLLLAAHLVLLNAGNGSASIANTVFQAIILLEDGLKTSKYNFQFRLLLTRLYAKLGAFQRCMEHFDNLEIKYIQHDTLSHYWLTHAAPLGHYSRATLLHNKALKFFSATFRDTSEYLIQAYRFGSFAKIPEFMRLRDRLTHSLQYSLVYVESLIYDLVLETDSHQRTEERISAMALDPVTDQTNWDLIQDNRDLRLMADWTAPTIDAQDERYKRNFRHEKAWAKLRHVTHHAVSAAISFAANGGGKEESSPNASSTTANGDAHEDVLPPPPQTKQKTPVDAEIVTRLIADFREHQSFCRREFVDNVEEEERLSVIHPLYASPPSRLFDYLRFGHPLDILVDAFQLVEYVFSLASAFSANKSAAKDAVNEKMEALLGTELVDSVKRMFDACLKATLSTGASTGATAKTPLQHDLYLHNFSVALETLALVVALMGACHKVLRPLKNSLTKKTKKKKGGGGGGDLPKTFVNFVAASTALRDEAAKFGERLEGISHQLALSEVGLGARLRNLTVDDEGMENHESSSFASSTQGDVLGQINESFEMSAAEMGALVVKKVAYLTSLTRL